MSFKQRELWNLTLTIHGRWFRTFAAYGTPPGSHIGFWRTRYGDLSGWNLRIGRRYSGPCLTLLVHTRPAREVIDTRP